MKIKSKVLIILLVCSASLFATPSALNIGFGNDLWTFGISQNNDDGLSFSSSIIYEDTKFSASLLYAGITNRGCIMNEQFEIGRYDILALDFTYDDIKYQTENFYATFTPRIGFSVLGNLALDKVQNFVHGTTQINKVDIPYEEGYIYALNLGGGLDIGYLVPFETSSNFLISFGLNTLTSLNFESEFKAYLTIALSSNNKRLLNFNFGYRILADYSDWMTQKLYNYNASGWYFGFDFKFGLLNLTYNTYMKNRVGYATYALNVLSFFEERTFKEADLNYSMLFTRMLNNNYHESEFFVEILDSNFFLGICSRYFSAAHLKQEIRAHGVSTSYYLKFSYAYDFPYITPFISLGLGFTSLSIVSYQDVTSSHLYDSDDDILFSSDLSIGFKLIPQGLVAFENVSYSLLLKCGVVMQPNESVVRKYLGPFNPRWENFSYLSYFSIGGVLSIDLL